MSYPLANFMKRFFTHYLPVQMGLSINTIRAYRDTIKLLLCYVAKALRKPVDKLDVEDVPEETVLGFLDHIEQVRGCSASTRNARLAALRTFFGFIANEEPELLLQCRRIRDVPQKRTAHNAIGYLEENEMQSLLDAVKGKTRTALRDKALLLLLYNTGARASEVLHITGPDLRLDEPAHVRLMGKGRKSRCCPLWPETATVLRAYIEERDSSHPGAEGMFLNANGSSLSRFGVGHIIGKYAERARTKCPSLRGKNITPHTIRHTTAMHLLRAQNDIHMVSYWLGHATLDTTHVYVEIDMEMKRKMIEKVDPPVVGKHAAWQKPGVLKWLNELTKEAELCKVNQEATGADARKQA
jgi:integrase/recombinase XerD